MFINSSKVICRLRLSSMKELSVSCAASMGACTADISSKVCMAAGWTTLPSTRDGE